MLTHAPTHRPPRLPAGADTVAPPPALTDSAAEQEEEEEDEKISLSTLECVPGPLRKARESGREGREGTFSASFFKSRQWEGEGIHSMRTYRNVKKQKVYLLQFYNCKSQGPTLVHWRFFLPRGGPWLWQPPGPSQASSVIARTHGRTPLTG